MISPFFKSKLGVYPYTTCTRIIVPKNIFLKQGDTPHIPKKRSMITDKPIKIVIVEDETLYIDMISKALDQEENIKVLGGYTTAEEATQAILKLRPDVALVDIELGHDTNGIKLTLGWRDLLNDLGIVLLSNHSKLSFAKVLARQELKGWAYLLKKSVRDLATLRRTIFSVNQGEVVLDKQLVRQLEHANSILTPRQWEILDLVSQGYANTAIAENLNLAVKSVENQLNEIYSKLSLNKTNKKINPRVKAVLMHLENQY